MFPFETVFVSFSVYISPDCLCTIQSNLPKWILFKWITRLNGTSTECVVYIPDDFINFFISVLYGAPAPTGFGMEHPTSLIRPWSRHSTGAFLASSLTLCDVVNSTLFAGRQQRCSRGAAQTDAGELASPSEHERQLLSRLTPDVVCQLIDGVFSELVAQFKVYAAPLSHSASVLPLVSETEIHPAVATVAQFRVHSRLSSRS